MLLWATLYNCRTNKNLKPYLRGCLFTFLVIPHKTVILIVAFFFVGCIFVFFFSLLILVKSKKKNKMLGEMQTAKKRQNVESVAIYGIFTFIMLGIKQSRLYLRRDILRLSFQWIIRSLHHLGSKETLCYFLNIVWPPFSLFF